MALKVLKAGRNLRARLYKLHFFKNRPTGDYVGYNRLKRLFIKLGFDYLPAESPIALMYSECRVNSKANRPEISSYIDIELRNTE